MLILGRVASEPSTADTAARPTTLPDSLLATPAPFDGAVVAPSPSSLTVLVAPDAPGHREESWTLRFERRVAEGIAELDGRRPRVVIAGSEAGMMNRLLAGNVDVVVAPLSALPARTEGIRISLACASGDGRRRVAVAVRREDQRLRRIANEFLISHALLGSDDAIHTDDLDGIQARRELRILAERGPASYFVHGGNEQGFEYELMSRFAQEHGWTVKVVVPPTRNDLVPWLLEGKGDVIASGFVVTPERARTVAFTHPYQNTFEAIVVREDDRVRDLDDLRGRTVHVRASSAHYETLRDLRQYDDDFEIAVVPETFTLEEILERVEDGRWDVTVCDSHLLEMERTAGRRLRAAFSIKAVRHAWAVRPDNPALCAALDEFLRTEYRGLHFNLLRQRYFECETSIAALQDEFRSDVSGRISPYDDLIRRYAPEFGLDWRLVAAQMYQESRFEKNGVSSAGARGLMQIMPSTARELGVKKLDPESSIQAGMRYLSGLIDRFEDDLPLGTRIRFALASYNAGRGHVEDARRLAARLGYSPDRWYGNVERALLLLQRPEYHRTARHGYCRGEETVGYVAEIDRRYRAYVENLPVPLASVEPTLSEPSS